MERQLPNSFVYCHSYRCRKCGDSLWKDARKLCNHESTCTGGVRRVYPGGVYHSTPSVFERLDDEIPYRATFDFEYWFDTEHLPSDSDQVHWVARHVPLSVSVASNVPGHEQVTCLVTDGDTNKLVSAMMTILQSMSEAAYDKIKDSYEDVLEQLAEALTNWDEREEAARSATDKDARPATNPYKTLMGQLYGWVRQLPVIGFNSGKYDLNAIKQFLIPYFLPTAKTVEQERRRGRGREGARGKQERRERRRRVNVRHQTQQHFHVSVDGSAEIPRHDQLHSPRVQLRQVSESVRMRGDERSFPVRVHGPSGETRRHRSSTERGLLQSTEERRYFRRGLRQLSGGLARQWHDDVARLSRLVQQQGRGSLSSGHRQTVCLLSTTWNRHVQARHQRTWSDPAVPVQRPSREDLLYHLQREE